MQVFIRIHKARGYLSELVLRELAKWQLRQPGTPFLLAEKNKPLSEVLQTTVMYQNGQTLGDIVFPGSNDIETSPIVHVHYPEESLFSLLLLAETVHAASNRVFIADRLEVKLQPTKLRLFGLLASLSSLNVADDHCNEFFFLRKFRDISF